MIAEVIVPQVCLNSIGPLWASVLSACMQYLTLHSTARRTVIGIIHTMAVAMMDTGIAIVIASCFKFLTSGLGATDQQ